MLGAIILIDRRNNGSSRPTFYQYTLRNMRIYAQLVCRLDAFC